jgi:hypothetical protein
VIAADERKTNADVLAMPRAMTAQVEKLFVKNGNKSLGWGTISVVDALVDRERVFLCSECDARVRPHSKSEKQEAHFEHLREFEGCSLSAAWDGRKRRNPQALR